jgi:hypothetical protein
MCRVQTTRILRSQERLTLRLGLRRAVNTSLRGLIRTDQGLPNHLEQDTSV